MRRLLRRDASPSTPPSASSPASSAASHRVLPSPDDGLPRRNVAVLPGRRRRALEAFNARTFSLFTNGSRREPTEAEESSRQASVEPLTNPAPASDPIAPGMGHVPTDHWRTLGSNVKLEFAGEARVDSFAQLLVRLGYSCDAQNESARHVLSARVDRILSELRGSEHLRAECFELAESALGSCVDRVALCLDLIDAAVIDHRAMSGRMTEAELFDTGRRLFRQRMLDELALKKIPAIEGADDVEVLLAYCVESADRLELPVGTKLMKFALYSKVSLPEIYDAVREVKEAEGGALMQQFLCDYPPWRKHLQRNRAEVFDDRLESVRARLDDLRIQPDDMNDFVYAERCATCFTEREAIEAEVLGELTRTAFRLAAPI